MNAEQLSYYVNQWPFFKPEELKCKCGKCHSTGYEMRPEFMEKLIALRKITGPLIISSGFRCSDYNAHVSKTGRNGPHTTGHAVDISIRGEEAFKLISIARSLGFTGIGVNQKGESRFIHLDDLETPDYPRPNLWSY